MFILIVSSNKAVQYIFYEAGIMENNVYKSWQVADLFV
jgi:hypothetical protein